MLRHDCADMGGVMLERKQGQPPLTGETFRKTAGKIVGVSVADDDTWFHFQQLQKMMQCFFKETEAFSTADIAYMLAGKGFLPPRKTESMLEFRTGRKHTVSGERNGRSGRGTGAGTKPRALRTISAG